MKTKILTLTALLAIAFVACEKKNCKKDSKDKLFCKLEDCVISANNEYEDCYNFPSDVQQYIIKPIVTDESDCIVKGFVKYVKNGKTVALVDYGNGESDKWAVKTICYDGDCDHDLTNCYKFEQVCDAR